MRAAFAQTLAICFSSMLYASEPMPVGLMLAENMPTDSACRIPAGWKLAGNKPTDYAVHIEANTHTGKNAAHISCIAKKPSGFGTLMQMFDATNYRGKRLRLTAYVKTLDVTDWAGLWMRIDGVSAPSLAFDNMQDRPIKGTTERAHYTVVLDVPDEAQAIGFGVLLAGPGSVWVDDFDFKAVESQVATTGKPPLPGSPQNMGFEK